MFQFHYITRVRVTIACDVGCGKLGLDGTSGTLIDEDEILMEKTTEVLMILMSGETWMSALTTAPHTASAANESTGCSSSGNLLKAGLTLTPTLPETLVVACEGETALLDQSKGILVQAVHGFILHFLNTDCRFAQL